MRISDWSSDVCSSDLDAIRSSAGELLWTVRLFDVFRGASTPDGHRSLAYALRLQAPDRTLTDADVAAVRQQVIDHVQSTLPATPRGSPHGRRPPTPPPPPPPNPGTRGRRSTRTPTSHPHPTNTT